MVGLIMFLHLTSIFFIFQVNCQNPAETQIQCKRTHSKTEIKNALCCQSYSPNKQFCVSNKTCIVKELDGSIGSSKYCSITQDNKFEHPNRSESEIVECMLGAWDEHDVFDEHDHLPFGIEMFPVYVKDVKYIGLDLRLHYIEFVLSRFRLMNLHHCGNPFADISPKCSPRCVRLSKTDKKDNQAFLSYDCETALVEDAFVGGITATYGDTYVLSMCMTNTGEEQRCGEFWFLIPPEDVIMDKEDPQHQVILLIDKEEYNTNSEVIVYVPTSHVLVHEADMLSVQLLTYFTEDPDDWVPFANDSCWHNKTSSAIIHTQNITFNKYPGQNIKVRLTRFLPSGKYQVAMVPYIKDDNGTMVAIAPPSCSCRLERIDLGKHALLIIFILLSCVILSGIGTALYNVKKEKEEEIERIEWCLEREEEKRRLLNPEEEINEILDFCQETGRSHESDLALKQRVSIFPLNNM